MVMMYKVTRILVVFLTCKPGNSIINCRLNKCDWKKESETH